MPAGTVADLQHLTDPIVDELLQLRPVFGLIADYLLKGYCKLRDDFFTRVDKVQCQGKKHIKILKFGVTCKSHFFPARVLLHLTVNLFYLPTFAVVVYCLLNDLNFCHLLVCKIAKQIKVLIFLPVPNVLANHNQTNFNAGVSF